MGEARSVVVAALMLVSLSACGDRNAPAPGSVQSPVVMSIPAPPTIYSPTPAAPEPLTDVDVVRGSSYMAQDLGPKTVTLAPAASLQSVVAWSGTVTAGEPVTGTALAVTSVPGENPQILRVETDLGTTGEIDVTAWSATSAE
jgi:hypothetical protein